MFINRKYDRTEEDDFRLHVQDRLNAYTEAIPKYFSDGTLCGWTIQCRCE